jgi:hypothetical protein
MSNLEIDGKLLEFTVIPVQHVPLGLLRNDAPVLFSLDKSQLAVYYASYLHLAKIAARDAFSISSGNPLKRVLTGSIIVAGSKMMLHAVGAVCKKNGLDLEKISKYGLRRTVVPTLHDSTCE